MIRYTRHESIEVHIPSLKDKHYLEHVQDCKRLWSQQQLLSMLSIPQLQHCTVGAQRYSTKFALVSRMFEFKQVFSYKWEPEGNSCCTHNLLDGSYIGCLLPRSDAAARLSHYGRCSE